MCTKIIYKSVRRRFDLKKKKKNGKSMKIVLTSNKSFKQKHEHREYR